MIKEVLENYVQAFSALGHPPIFQTFILRNGTIFQGEKRPKGLRKRTDKMCFMNATNLTLQDGYDYYEGIAIGSTIPLPIHHAWNAEGGKVIDSTWRSPETSEYMGVHIPTEKLRRIVLKNRFYGVFDTGLGYNMELMFEMDPELRSIVSSGR